jgi:hypothetical protein
MIPNRFLLVSVATLGLASSADPAAAGAPVSFGFRTGVASSSFLGEYDDAVGSDSRTGFATAMFCRLPLSRLFSIQPELAWTSKGDQGELAFTYIPTGGPSLAPVTISNPFEHRIDYVEIPALLRLGAPNGSLFEPYLLMGPSVAFRIPSYGRKRPLTPYASANNARVHGASIFENAGTFDSPHYRDVDWSVIAGGGLALGRAPFRIVVDSRCALGLVGTFAGADRSFAHNGSWVTTLGIELR